jgi:DNA polymerase III subunit delta
LKPVYYFYGEPAAVADALAALKKSFGGDALNVSSFDGSDPQAIVSEALTSPVFSERRLIVVDNPKLSASAKAALAEYVKNPLETTTLAMISEESRLDARDPLAAAVGKDATYCGPLRPEEAERRLDAEAKKAGKTLAPGAADVLIEEAGTDWPILRQELEKALLFSGQAKAVTREHVLECLGYQKALDPFALSNLTETRSMKEALIHLRKMLRSGKADDQAFKALSQISGMVLKQYKAKKMLAAGAPPPEIQGKLRVHPAYYSRFVEKLARLNPARLRRDLEYCAEVEASLKSRAWLDPKLELERLVVAVCS